MSARRNKKIEDQRALDFENERVILTALMSTKASRRWVWLLLSECQIFVDDGVIEPFRMAFDKGRRSVGLRLLSSITVHTPQEYVDMTNEANAVTLSYNKDVGPNLALVPDPTDLEEENEDD